MSAPPSPEPKICQSCWKRPAVALINKRYRCQWCIDQREKQMKQQKEKAEHGTRT